MLLESFASLLGQALVCLTRCAGRTQEVVDLDGILVRTVRAFYSEAARSGWEPGTPTSLSRTQGVSTVKTRPSRFTIHWECDKSSHEDSNLFVTMRCSGGQHRCTATLSAFGCPLSTQQHCPLLFAVVIHVIHVSPGLLCVMALSWHRWCPVS